MPFNSYKDIIEEGDLVLAYINRNHIKPIRVTKDEILNTRYGCFEHNEMIGMLYGEQMGGSRGYGYIYLLAFTPELWTVSLPHRTQIVYTHDSSYIIQRLNIVSGSRVIEAGTGSGSFSHAFSRTVGLEGKLFSYEFHEPRFIEAKAEFEDHGLDKNTLITHRDVCKDGFELHDIPQPFVKDSGIAADAIFLDLPSPWEAIPHLKAVASSTRRVGICCFSPCMEQVVKTVTALNENGWVDVEMVEVAGRRWEARKEMLKDVNDVIKRLKDIQARRNQGLELLKQSRASTPGEKREASNPESGEANPVKVQNTGMGFNPFGRGLRIKEGDEKFEWRDVTGIEPDVKTHTSYLTFAYLQPPPSARVSL